MSADDAYNSARAAILEAIKNGTTLVADPGGYHMDRIRIPSQHIINPGEGIEPSKREKIHERVKHHSARHWGLRATPL
jgi:hypothetical protein